jgi:hypothetical protein
MKRKNDQRSDNVINGFAGLKRLSEMHFKG